MNLENTLALIPNPKAGRWNDQEIQRIKGMEHDKLHVIVPEGYNQARELAKKILKKGYGAICPGGGDGTTFLWLNLMIQEAQGRPLPKIVVGKWGTGRSYKHLVGAKDDAKQLEMIMDHEFRNLPTLEVPLIGIDLSGEEQPFYHTIAGTGWDAKILDAYNQIAGKHIWNLVDKIPHAGKTLVYLAASLDAATREVREKKQLDDMTLSSSSHVFKMDENDQAVQMNNKEAFNFDEPIQYVIIGTTPYFGFKFKALPFALKGHHYSQQKMHLRVVTGKPWKLIPEVFSHLPAVWSGEYRSKNMHDFLVEDVSVKFKNKNPVQIAGESKDRRSSFQAEVSEYRAHLVDFNRM